MANKGNENGKHPGLGIFDGEVKMIPKIVEKPTIGWKTIMKNSKLTFLKSIIIVNFIMFIVII